MVSLDTDLDVAPGISKDEQIRKLCTVQISGQEDLLNIAGSEDAIKIIENKVRGWIIVWLRNMVGTLLRLHLLKMATRKLKRQIVFLCQLLILLSLKEYINV
jgi:hypothetical protein